MNHETKRDVFEVALNHATKTGWVDYGQLSDRYDAALPDGLPVIPKAVSDYISKAKILDLLRAELEDFSKKLAGNKSITIDDIVSEANAKLVAYTDKFGPMPPIEIMEDFK